MTRPRVRLERALLCLAILVLLIKTAHPQAVRWDAGAGGFAGDRPTYNGPVFQVRVSAAVRPSAWVALRATYRDDDESSGRARSVGLLGEALFVLQGHSKALYVPVGLGLEWVSVTATGPLPPGDAKSGPYVAGDVGLGVELNAGSRRVIVEGRQSFRRFGNSRSVVVGVRSYAPRRPGNAAAFDLMATVPHPLTNAYARDSRYQGHAVAYRHPLTGAGPADLRVLVGIEFLRFTAGGGAWSTGAITIAGGTGVRVFADRGHNVLVSLVAHGGLLLFAEPSSTGPSPRVGIGPELRWTPGPVGVVVASEGVAAGGPAGTFTALETRIGLTLGL
jgi:hypothetical protein